VLYQNVKEHPHIYSQRFDDGSGLVKVYIYMILS